MLYGRFFSLWWFTDTMFILYSFLPLIIRNILMVKRHDDHFLAFCLYNFVNVVNNKSTRDWRQDVIRKKLLQKFLLWLQNSRNRQFGLIHRERNYFKCNARIWMYLLFVIGRERSKEISEREFWNASEEQFNQMRCVAFHFVPFGHCWIIYNLHWLKRWLRLTEYDWWLHLHILTKRVSILFVYFCFHFILFAILFTTI